MTDDLRPKSHLLAIIGTAVAVGSAVWGSTTWLNGRADKPAVEKLANESFQQRLDAEVFKGELKAMNIRLERIEKGFDSLNEKLDEPRRRR